MLKKSSKVIRHEMVIVKFEPKWVHLALALFFQKLFRLHFWFFENLKFCYYFLNLDLVTEGATHQKEARILLSNVNTQDILGWADLKLRPIINPSSKKTEFIIGNLSFVS